MGGIGGVQREAKKNLSQVHSPHSHLYFFQPYVLSLVKCERKYSVKTLRSSLSKIFLRFLVSASGGQERRIFLVTRASK